MIPTSVGTAKPKTCLGTSLGRGEAEAIALALTGKAQLLGVDDK